MGALTPPPCVGAPRPMAVRAPSDALPCELVRRADITRPSGRWARARSRLLIAAVEASTACRSREVAAAISLEEIAPIE